MPGCKTKKYGLTVHRRRYFPAPGVCPPIESLIRRQSRVITRTRIDDNHASQSQPDIRRLSFGAQRMPPKDMDSGSPWRAQKNPFAVMGIRRDLFQYDIEIFEEARCFGKREQGFPEFVVFRVDKIIIRSRKVSVGKVCLTERTIFQATVMKNSIGQ